MKKVPIVKGVQPYDLHSQVMEDARTLTMTAKQSKKCNCSEKKHHQFLLRWMLRKNIKISDIVKENEYCKSIIMSCETEL